MSKHLFIVAIAVTMTLLNACTHKSGFADQQNATSSNIPPTSTSPWNTTKTVTKAGAQIAVQAGASGFEYVQNLWVSHGPARAGAVAGFSAGFKQTSSLLADLPALAKELGTVALKADYKECFDSLSPNVQRFLLAAPGAAKQKLDSLPSDVREFLVEFDGDISLAFGNRPASEHTEFKVGYISGWIGWQAATVVLCDRVLRLAAEGKVALSGDKTARLAASRARYRKLCNRESRIPENEGRWSGIRGESPWKSELPEVNAITRGKTVSFKNGTPEFSPWSQGTLKFTKGDLRGTQEDFSCIYNKLAAEKNLSGETAAREYLRRKGLTPHHLNETVVQLIPTALHANIPHTGGAAFLRTGVR